MNVMAIARRVKQILHFLHRLHPRGGQNRNRVEAEEVPGAITIARNRWRAFASHGNRLVPALPGRRWDPPKGGLEYRPPIDQLPRLGGKQDPGRPQLVSKIGAEGGQSLAVQQFASWYRSNGCCGQKD